MLVVLSLWWLVIQQVPMVLGYEHEAGLRQGVLGERSRLARGRRVEAVDPGQGGVRRTNGEQTFTLSGDGDAESPDACRYKVAASERRGAAGR